MVSVGVMRSTPGVHGTDTHAETICFSFSGGGVLGLFHLGVAKYIQERFVHTHDNYHYKYGGVSCGAIVATLLCCNCHIESFVQDVLDFYITNPKNIILFT